MYKGFYGNRRVHRSFIKSWVRLICHLIKHAFLTVYRILFAAKKLKNFSKDTKASLKQIYNEQYIAALLTHDYEHKLKITADGPVWRTL
ncbi:hypothetical protein T01_13750 [Trichinella spiralis]|uniref:Uncharacterized protein n=1 Tax=Trichinella spiralis TaxID=6334 RepID=A0A0V1B837_TRISP|nr:hypothetical protein T01_13750 [Trichinella spiralis]